MDILVVSDPAHSQFDLSIIIVNFNTRDLTLECIRSVFRETNSIRFEIILVDNGSDDGSADAIAQEFGERVKLISSMTNDGFAKANNRAAEIATGKYILLLNSDTIVIEQAIVKLLAKMQAEQDVGIGGGRTLYGDLSLNPTSCFNLPTLWSTFCRMIGFTAIFPRSEFFNWEEIGDWQRCTQRSVGVITGCFLMLSKELWLKLGGFDSRFFMYSEDTDLSARTWKLGLRCVCFPDATIVHYGGQSEVTRVDKMVKVLKSRCLFFRIHWEPTSAYLGCWMVYFTVLGRAAILSLLAKVNQKHVAAQQQWSGVWRRRRDFVS